MNKSSKACIFCAIAVLAFSGCATGGSGGKAEAVKSKSSMPLPPGVTLTRGKHLQGIWVADGFRFSGFDAVVVATPAFKAVERSNEINERAIAIKGIQDALVVALKETGAFASVVIRADEVKAGSRFAVLETTVFEYEKGGGGARRRPAPAPAPAPAPGSRRRRRRRRCCRGSRGPAPSRPSRGPCPAPCRRWARAPCRAPSPR